MCLVSGPHLAFTGRCRYAYCSTKRSPRAFRHLGLPLPGYLAPALQSHDLVLTTAKGAGHLPYSGGPTRLVSCAGPWTQHAVLRYPHCTELQVYAHSPSEHSHSSTSDSDLPLCQIGAANVRDELQSIGVLRFWDFVRDVPAYLPIGRHRAIRPIPISDVLGVGLP